jgi:glycosyltransferase involved in cell wall biosynthesis
VTHRAHITAAIPALTRGSRSATSVDAVCGSADRTVADALGRPILVVAPQPFYQDRGTPIALRQVLTALSELGRRVDLVTYPVGLDVPVPGLRLFRAANPLGYTSVPIGFSLRKLVLDVPLIGTLSARLATERYACVHAVEEAAFPAALLARRHRLPLLYDMQSSMAEQLSRLPLLHSAPGRRLLDGAERWLVRRSTLVVTSAGLASRVGAMAPGTPVREWHFPSAPGEADPADVERLRARLGVTGPGPVILYSGTFEAYQGLDELVESIPLVLARAPSARFVLVGAQGVEGLPARAAALVAAGTLRVVDRQPRDGMATFLAMADVLVSARAYGGNLPLKIFDYLAAGRPIVATDIPTHRSVLSEERAVLVEPTAAALAEGIAGLLADPTRGRGLAAAARAYARAHLGWDRFVSSVETLDHEVEQHARARR